MIITTDYSLFSSAIKINDAVNTESKFLILADDNISATPTFVYACREKGIKPIIGVRKELGGAEYLFIALNDKGLHELMRIESLGIKDSDLKLENIIPLMIKVVDEDGEINKVKYALSSTEKNNILLSRYVEQLLPAKIVNGIKDSDFYKLAMIYSIGNTISFEKAATEIEFNNDIGDLDSIQFIIDLAVDDFSFGNPKPPQFKFLNEVSTSEGIFFDGIKDDDLFAHLCRVGLEKRFNNQIIPDNYKERLEFEINVINNMKFPGYFLIVWDFINWAKENDIPVGPGRGSAAGSLVAYSLGITDLDPIPYDLLFERFLNPDRVSFPDIDIDFCKNGRERVINYVSNKYGAECVSQVITFGRIGGKSSIRDAARSLSVPLYLADKMAKSISDKPGTTLESAYKDSKEMWDEWFEKDYAASKTWKGAEEINGFTRNLGIHAAGLIIGNVPIYTKAPLYTVKDTQAVGFDGKYLEDFDLVKFDFLGLQTLTIIDEALKIAKKDYSVFDLKNEEIYKYISQGNNSGLFQIESSGMKDLAKRLKPSNFEDVTAMLALYRPGPMEAGMLDSFIERKHGREKIDYFFDEMEDALKPILEPTYGLIVYQEQVMKIVQVIGGFTLGEADLVRRAMGKKKKEEMEKLSIEFANGAEKLGYQRKNAIKLFELIEKFAGYGFNKSHSAAYAQLTVQTAHLKLYHPKEFLVSLINNNIDDTNKMSAYVSETKRMGINVLKPDIKVSSSDFKIVGDEIVFGLKAIKGIGGGSEGLQVLARSGLSLKEILTESQTDKNKETSKLQKLIERHQAKLIRLNNDIEKVRAQIEKITTKVTNTEKEMERFATYNAKIEALIGDYNGICGEINDVNAELSQLNIMPDVDKINKRVLEALAVTGALESFGVSRKFVIDNLESLIKLNSMDNLDFNSKDEYSIIEKINLEFEKMGLVLTDPFPDLSGIDIPDDNPVLFFLGTKESFKKNGDKYSVVSFLTPENEIVEFSDFNGKLNKFNLGDILSVALIHNGRYTNIGNVMKFRADKYCKAEDQEKTLKLNTLDSFEDIDLKSYNVIEVYDKGQLIAIMR